MQSPPKIIYLKKPPSPPPPPGNRIVAPLGLPWLPRILCGYHDVGNYPHGDTMKTMECPGDICVHIIHVVCIKVTSVVWPCCVPVTSVTLLTPDTSTLH